MQLIATLASEAGKEMLPQRIENQTFKVITAGLRKQIRQRVRTELQMHGTGYLLLVRSLQST